MGMECWGTSKVLRQKRLLVTNAGGFHYQLFFYAGRESAPASSLIRISCQWKLDREMVSADLMRAQFLYISMNRRINI